MQENQISDTEIIESLSEYQYDWKDDDSIGSTSSRGLDESVVRKISHAKNEPEWMLERRLKGLELFNKTPNPSWGIDFEGLDYQNFKYYVAHTIDGKEVGAATAWEDLPEDIRNTYDKLGLPEAEKKRLVAGVAAQYESEMVYHSIRQDLEKQGVIFTDTETGLREHPEIFKEYFGAVVPDADNKLAMLNLAVWSGGSFVYVPKTSRWKSLSKPTSA